MGTALAVIVPEGAESFYEMREHADEGATEAPNAIVGGALLAGFLAMLILENINWGGTAAHGHGHGSRVKQDTSDGEDDKAHHHGHAERSAAVPIRESPGGAGGSGGSRSDGGGSARSYYTLAEVILGRGRRGEGPDTPGADLPMWRLEGFQTLVGILVHSFADGAAVSVAALSPNRSLGMLVALAIILHKAPAAFGLCTYLLNTGWSLGRTRRAMAIFSLASPLSALFVYFTILSMPMLNQPLSVPLCLLLSGGTFLYAACIHILPETVGPGGRLTLGQVAAVTMGAVIPFGLSLTHSHGHGGHGVGEDGAHAHVHRIM